MNVHLIILIIHIISGFTALTVGIIPMVVQKGGRIHRLSGKIYAIAMYGISASTVGLFLLHPEKPFLQFLLCIGMLGFYFTFTGVRSITLHRNKVNSFITDRLVAWITLSTSFLMLVYGCYFLANAITAHTAIFLGILYIVFGLTMGSAAFADTKAFSSKNDPEKMRWFFNHIVRILSAYIATFTAFCVVNVHFLPPLIVWILPGIIGGTIITFIVRKYKRKFAEGKALLTIPIPD